MGRPPLHMKPTQVRLPEEVMRRIDRIVGQKRRAEFIRQAVLKELERIERIPTEPNDNNSRR